MRERDEQDIQEGEKKAAEVGPRHHALDAFRTCSSSGYRSNNLTLLPGNKVTSEACEGSGLSLLDLPAPPMEQGSQGDPMRVVQCRSRVVLAHPNTSYNMELVGFDVVVQRLNITY